MADNMTAERIAELRALCEPGTGLVGATKFFGQARVGLLESLDEIADLQKKRDTALANRDAYSKERDRLYDEFYKLAKILGIELGLSKDSTHIQVENKVKELLERMKTISTIIEQDKVVQACVEEASREIAGLTEDNDPDVDDGPQIERIVRDQINRALEHMTSECNELFDLCAKYEGVFVDLKGDADIDWLVLDPDHIGEEEVERWSCKFCNNKAVESEKLEHDDECPIAIANAVHEENKEKLEAEAKKLE